ALSNWIPIPSSLGALTLALTQRLALLLVVLLIARELFMFTSRSTQFNAQGFVLVLCASSLGRIRWTLMQILMLQNPTDTMFHLEPLMFLGLFPLFAVFEGLPLSISEKLFHFHEAGLPFSLVGKLFLGGILAFGLGFSEFLFVSRTSSLILSIAGIFKEICILFLATRLLGDRLRISLHVILKAMNSKGDSVLNPFLFLCSSEPDLELLLHHTEHVEEGEEDAETPQH
uniref:Solute carrier family 35 member C2 n=1 Tax=Falco tinnunculus TaxID=100819 RepID=A0A8C4TXW2_FALTI